MIDITRALKEGHPQWPGDSPFELTQVAHIAKGDSVNVMRLSTSNHIGTHMDAPYHYDDAGRRLGGVSLERLLGPCQVIHALALNPVTPELLEPLGELPERVLLRTGQPEEWTEFPKDFTPLSPELIHALSERGVKLVGTDSPSVDAFNSKDLPVHQACAETDMIIVEGLNLQRVDEGHYELICLPLNMPEADGSPVRAILQELA